MNTKLSSNWDWGMGMGNVIGKVPPVPGDDR